MADEAVAGRDSRVGLALAGGGARGLAQVGAIKVLEREGVPVDMIAGTSMGSIIGALYASLGDAAALERTVRETLLSPEVSGVGLARVFRMSGLLSRGEPETAGSGLWARARRGLGRLRAVHAALTRQAVLPGPAVLELLRDLLGERTFEGLQIPFAAVAVDLERGREVMIRRGSLARAVAASSAVAGIFPPVEIEGVELIDGGYTSPVPVDAVRSMGADVVVAVDVSLGTLEERRPESAVGVAMRSSEICMVALEKEQLRRADVTIRAGGRPRHWSDYSDPDEAIGAGVTAAERSLDTIRDVLGSGTRMHL